MSIWGVILSTASVVNGRHILAQADDGPGSFGFQLGFVILLVTWVAFFAFIAHLAENRRHPHTGVIKVLAFFGILLPLIVWAALIIWVLSEPKPEVELTRGELVEKHIYLVRGTDRQGKRIKVKLEAASGFLARESVTARGIRVDSVDLFRPVVAPESDAKS